MLAMVAENHADQMPGRAMFHLLIDTCVWLDLAENPKQASLLTVIEQLVREGDVRLLVPTVVFGEFERNKAQVEQRSSQSLKSQIGQVKQALQRIGTETRRERALLQQLDDLNHRAPLIGGEARGRIKRIQALLAEATALAASPAIKVRAADRALAKAAPCHRHNKNSLADAVVIESYFDCVQSGPARERFAFVSSNTSDFSNPTGNQKLPHPDLAQGFSRIRSLYFINLGDCLRRIAPSLTSEAAWEEHFYFEPRGLQELLGAEELLFFQVWFNRHKNLQWKIDNGQVRVVDKATWDQSAVKHEIIVDDVWKGARKSAAKALKKFGSGNFGPWDDFEWGMINGKLSAIRWMLGDEWDMLDT